MDGKSLDIKQDKLEKLKELFPEVFTEDRIDWEKLKATLGEDINFSNEPVCPELGGQVRRLQGFAGTHNSHVGSRQERVA
jgi:hypothetical protein